jgi:hypothetical protein
MFKKLLYFAIFIAVPSCTTDDLDSQLSKHNSPASQNVITIDINTTRNPYNMINSSGIHSDHLTNTRSSNDEDPFVEEKIVESSESVVLPELTPHVFLGNIMRRSSIVDCQYVPLVSVNPISVALTLPNTTPATINNTSSVYINYINNQTAKGTYSQNNEFYFSVEQFTSYNELKSTFGNNSNTSFLFWGSSSSSEHEERQISKATGIYLKFWQTSFKAVMDYPSDLATQVPQNLLDSLVYINSITYGRLGIMTLETNSTAAYAKTILTDSYNTIMSKGGSYLTQEQREFLEGCEFKVYLIYANGRAGVETIYGLEGFVNCIKKGVFTKDNPGGPLFCTFNNVKDNSPVKVRFKYNIRKEPLYVEMKTQRDNEGYFQMALYFYRNKSKVPTIANPKLKLKVRHDCETYRREEGYRKTTSYNYYQNAPQNTSLIIMPRFHFHTESSIRVGRDEKVLVSSTDSEYTLEVDDGYEVIGKAKHTASDH